MSGEFSYGLIEYSVLKVSLNQNDSAGRKNKRTKQLF